MFPYAHLGIGGAAGLWFARRLPLAWILVGTILPDLIDKPVFYVLSRIPSFHAAGWESGKRGFAHTLAFLMLLVAISFLWRSRRLGAVTFGTATHLVLDVISKSIYGNFMALHVLLWPAFGWEFPMLSFGMDRFYLTILDMIGAVFLFVQFEVVRSRRHRPDY